MVSCLLKEKGKGYYRIKIAMERIKFRQKIIVKRQILLDKFDVIIQAECTSETLHNVEV